MVETIITKKRVTSHKLVSMSITTGDSQVWVPKPMTASNGDQGAVELWLNRNWSGHTCEGSCRFLGLTRNTGVQIAT